MEADHARLESTFAHERAAEGERLLSGGGSRKACAGAGWDVKEYAVGRNSAAAWAVDEDHKVRRVWTDALPCAEVERVAPNEDRSLTDAVTFGMEELAALAAADPVRFAAAIRPLPVQYREWIAAQAGKLTTLPPGVERPPPTRTWPWRHARH